jgi:chloramphenicol 3-O phosphotransferase
VTPGRVVVLDGTSSSGKTTLARNLQARLVAAAELWIVTGVDDYFAKLPRAWYAIGGHRGPHADEGFVFDTDVPGGFEMRMGPAVCTMLRAYRESIGAMARAGINVIVDDVQLRDVEWEMWQHAVEGLDVTWVQVRIDLDILVAREEARADRVLGMARWQYDQVHRNPTYDVTIDTGVLDPDAAADALVSFLGTRR